MSNERQPLDYAVPRRRSSDLAIAVAWPCAFVGLVLGLVFAVAAANFLIKSLAHKTTSVDRPYFQMNAQRLGACAIVVWLPSIWFIASGEKKLRRELVSSDE